MKNSMILTLLIGLLIGVAGTLGVVALLKDDSPTQQSQVTDHSMMSMDQMSEELEGLSGDAYDKAFIEMMIAHHQGAIDMAKLSETRAEHDEIKELSKNIITAQEKEISDMMQWQVDWGYQPNESFQMMHSGH